MKSRARVDVIVEPLSELKRARLERALFAALDAAPLAAPAPRRETKSRRVVVACLGAAAVAAAAALVSRGLLAPPRDDLVRVATGDGASRFTFGEVSLELLPHSAAFVHGDDARGTSVLLDHGGLTCEVPPRRGRPPFTVEAGDVKIRVVGTRFSVLRDGGGARVAVDHGTVEVSWNGSVTLLHDGDRWPLAPTTARPPSSADEIPSTAAPGPPPEKTAAPAKAPRAGRSAPRSTSAPPRPGLGPSRSVGDRPPPAPSVSAPPSQPQAQFEEATTLERTNPARAAELYRSVAAGKSPWAANALFALARLEIERGRRDEGRELLRRYLASYPSGVNAPDARALLQRLP